MPAAIRYRMQQILWRMMEVGGRRLPGVDVCMKRARVSTAVLAGIAAFCFPLYGQAPAKPSPYTGISQPPPDDTIISDDQGNANPTVKTRAKLAQTTPASGQLQPSAALPAAGSTPALAAVVPGRPCNPDDRMIGDPDPCEMPIAEAPRRRLANDADADIVTFVPTRPGELPESTIIRIVLDQNLSTSETQAGSDFSGHVTADVLSSGKVVIPQGAQIMGRVVQVTEGHRFGSPATIRLRPDAVVLPDGSRYVLRAQVIDTSTRSRIGDEGAVEPASRVKTNVIKEGAGIGTGAVAGALIGGAPGAMVGSIIGAGVMTTNILVQHPASVNLPKDSVLTLSLVQPMVITPEVASNN